MKSRVFVGLSSFQVLAFFRRGMFYAFLSLYLHFILGFSVTESTLFATFSMLASSLAQSFLWGPIADKIYNRKYMVVGSEILAAIGIFLVWWAHNVAYMEFSPYIAGWVITFGLTLVEAIWSASNVAWSALLSDISPQKQRGTMVGLLGAVGGFGRMIGVLAAMLLYNYGGIEGGGFLLGPLFILTSLVIVLTAFIIQMSILKTDLVYRLKDEDEFEKSTEIIPLGKNNYIRVFAIFLISLALINFGRNSVVLISNFFLVHRFNADSNVIGIFELITSGSIILAGFLTPVLIKQYGDWKVYFLASIMVMVSLIGFVFSPILELTIVFGFSIWSVHIIIEATSYSIVARIIPVYLRGRLYGFYNAVFFLSWGIGGTFFTGPITDFLISSGFGEIFAYTIAFISASVIVFLGILLSFLTYLKYPKPEKTNLIT
jgi:MFS family permease